MPGKTKKQLILEIFDQESMTCLGEAEVQLIERRLAQMAGGGKASSRNYIARVLAEAGKRVQITDPFSLPVMEEPYRQVFEGLLKYGMLKQAEHSLRQISSIYCKYKEAGDAKGMAYARSVVLVGKRRAQAASKRASSPEASELKREIAEWFTLWLYAPGLFNDWLDLRKQSPTFKEKWGSK